MSTYYEKLQNAWHAFEDRYGPAKSSREVAAFAMREGYTERPVYDPEGRVAADIAKALREEYETDRLGRRYRVNHAYRIKKDGVQTTLWSSMKRIDAPCFTLSIKDRKRGIRAQVEHLATDIDVFNDTHPDEKVAQLSFNFDIEREERRLAKLTEEELAREISLSSSTEPEPLH